MAKRHAKTGVVTFDEAFGGIPENAITLIYGGPATCKTLLALSFTKTQLAEGCAGVYVDADLSLTPRLLRALTSEDVLFFRPLSGDDYIAALYAASFFLSRGRFIVIDSVSLHGRGLGGEAVSRFLDLLKPLCYIKNSLVSRGGMALMTAHSLAGEGPTPKFCVVISDVIFKLSRSADKAWVEVVCERHFDKALEGRSTTFSVEDLVSSLVKET